MRPSGVILALVVGALAATGACAQIVGISDGFHGESEAAGGAASTSTQPSSATGHPATGSTSSSTSTHPMSSASATGTGGAPVTTSAGTGGATSTTATGTGGDGAVTATSSSTGGLGNGTACNDPASCTSGHCSQGFCCDMDCSAQCMTCNGQNTQSPAGTCDKIAGGFNDPRDPCFMYCDPNSSTWFGDVCDGTGACLQQPCGTDVVCNGTNDCRTCQTQLDCAHQFDRCVNGMCVTRSAAGGGAFN